MPIRPRERFATPFRAIFAAAPGTSTSSRLISTLRRNSAREEHKMTPKTPAEIGGMGHSVKRKEDPRFIRGQGTYVDDIVLPDMLYLDIVRSPYAHATIKSIDTSKALAIPGVLAVITGKDLAQYNLHWMPTLMSDTQMVLPVDRKSVV